jgi:hypothetical protein
MQKPLPNFGKGFFAFNHDYRFSGSEKYVVKKK